MRSSVLLLVAAITVVACPVSAERTKAQRSDIENIGDSPDRMICKRYTEIGSLVASHKECHTKREWSRKYLSLNSGTLGTASCNMDVCPAGH